MHHKHIEEPPTRLEKWVCRNYNWLAPILTIATIIAAIKTGR